MRTKIAATWIVAHERGQHALIRDGALVYEDNRIIHVGKEFEGRIDRTIDATGMLVAPGFIDTHVHSGHRASHRLITDTGRPMYYGQPFLEISVPKEGKVVKGDPRYLKHGDAGSAAAFELNAAFTVAELLRNGVTTFVEYGSQLSVQDALLAEVTRLGARAYLAPGYDCGRWVADASGRLDRVRDDELGRRGLQDCARLDRKERRRRGWPHSRHFGAARGRDRESRTAASTPRRAADETQAADGDPRRLQRHRVLRGRQGAHEDADRAPRSPRHAAPYPQYRARQFHLRQSQPQLFAHRDLDRMGKAGVSVSHCPINIVRRARVLDNWQRYQDAGVNMCIGSDTYPRDMIMNMRTASYLGKITSHSYFAATAADVFRAATVGGAISLGRDDLGRLAPGALADIIMIDLSGRNTLRYGPVRDPVKSVVECGVGDDVDTVIVDGKTVMQGGVIAGVDFAELRSAGASRGRADLGHAARTGTRSAAPTSRPAPCPIRRPSELRNMCELGQRTALATQCLQRREQTYER